MKTLGSDPSPRERIRVEAMRALQTAAGGKLHVGEIAALILPVLGLGGTVTVKTINNILHQDPKRRFLRVDRGMWKLR